jgi:transposase
VAGVEAAWSAAEKKSLHATERDTEENRRKREAFVQAIRTVSSEDLIYLDESGVSTQMTRLYGRAEGGQRVHDAVPGGHWKMLTILGAMDHTGMLAAMTIEAAADGDIFLAYLDHVLCPKLRPGHVVVMDNLSAHKVEGVRERIQACGASLLYLPPYSPDLNPIEKAWSKLKTGLRAAGAKTLQALEQAVQNLLPSISPKDARAWFLLRYGDIPQ